MKYFRRLSSCIGAAALFPVAVSAIEPVRFEVRKNADLVAVCATPATDPDYVAAVHFCHGVAVGFSRYHEALQEGAHFRPIFCVPESLTRTQTIAAYIAYSRRHPEYDGASVGDAVIKFLSDTYPCSGKAPATKP